MSCHTVSVILREECTMKPNLQNLTFLFVRLFVCGADSCEIDGGDDSRASSADMILQEFDPSWKPKIIP